MMTAVGFSSAEIRSIVTTCVARQNGCSFIGSERSELTLFCLFIIFQHRAYTLGACFASSTNTPVRLLLEHVNEQELF